jgi:hypothetical protein
MRLCTLLVLGLLGCSPAVEDDTPSGTATDPSVGDDDDTDADTDADTDVEIEPDPPACGTLVSTTGFGTESGAWSGDGVLSSDGARYRSVRFYEPITFDAGGPNEVTLTAASGYGASVVRTSEAGDLEWVRQFSSTGTVSVSDLHELPDGGIFVMGVYRETLTVAFGEPDAQDITAVGDLDAWMARFGPTGDLIWVKTWGGDGADFTLVVDMLDDDGLVVSCGHPSDVTFGVGEPNERFMPVPDGVRYKACFARYDYLTGELVWIQTINTDLQTKVSDFATDGSDLIFTGYFIDEGTAIFGPGQPGAIQVGVETDYSGYIARYQSDGTVVDVQIIEDRFADVVDLTPDGSVVAAGTYADNVTFARGTPQEVTLASEAWAELFVARYDPNGTFEWVAHSETEPEKHVFGMDVVGLSDGGAMVITRFNARARFGFTANAVVYDAADTDGGYNGAAVAYDTNGMVSCGREFDSPTYSYLQYIVDRPDGTFDLWGFFEEEVTISPGEPDETTLSTPLELEAFRVNMAF